MLLVSNNWRGEDNFRTGGVHVFANSGRAPCPAIVQNRTPVVGELLLEPRRRKALSNWCCRWKETLTEKCDEKRGQFGPVLLTTRS